MNGDTYEEQISMKMNRLIHICSEVNLLRRETRTIDFCDHLEMMCCFVNVVILDALPP